MRVMILFVAILSFFAIDGFAQVKQAQKSYLRDKGAFINPGFDQGYKGWTITGCTKSLETDVPTYGKTLKLTCVNETFSIKQETTSYAGFGLEGLRSCKVKASALGGKVRNIVDGVPSGTFETVVTGGYNNYEEFITFGATSDGLEVYADANYTGDIYLEDCYVSVKPDGSYELPDQTGNFGKVLGANDAQGEYWVKPGRLNSQLKGNLLSNGSFESGSPEGVIVVGSGLDTSTSTTRTIQASANNESKFVISGSASDTISYTYTKTEDFSDQQMMAFCQIKSDRAETYFRVYADSVLQGEHLISTDNKWRFYEIPFVGGGTDQKFVIEGTTAATEEIHIDECYFGVARPDFFQSVNDTITDWKVSDTVVWLAETVNPIIGNGTIEAKTRRVGDSIEVLISVAMGSTTTFGSGNWYFAFTDWERDSAKLNTDRSVLGQTWFYDNSISTTKTGVVRYRASNDAMYLSAHDSTAVNSTVPWTWASGDRFSVRYTVPVKGWSTENSTAVTQKTELDVNTMNRFSVDLTYVVGGAPTIDKDEYGILDGVSFSNPFATVYVKKSLFREAPVMLCGFRNGFNSDDNELCARNTGGDTATGWAYRFFSFRTSTGYITRQFVFTFDKVGVDINKSATIVGKFENINDTPNSGMVSESGANVTLTANSVNVPFLSVKDVNNNWNNTTNEFTASADGFYVFQGRVNTTGNHFLRIWIDSGSGYVAGKYINGANTNKAFDITVYLLAGNKVALRSDTTVGMSAGVTNHYMSINRFADYDALVKNLSKSKTLCQIKFLTSDVTTSGPISDWTLNNLEVGKKYSLEINSLWAFTTTDNVAIRTTHNGSTLVDFNQGLEISAATSISSSSKKIKFNATDTTVSFATISQTGADLRGDSTLNESFIEFCELPATVIETTKFD
jgi:hypothetical protein